MTACKRETVASCLSDTRLVEAWPTVTRWPLSVINSRPDGFPIFKWEDM